MMSFSEWLQAKASANRLETSELVLARFRATADLDPEFTTRVGAVLWALLSTSPGDDAPTLLADMRNRVAALGPERLDTLSSRLLQATGMKGEIEREAGNLVASWFRTIGLCSVPAPHTHRALHIVGAYERTFASLGRLMNKTSNTPHFDCERAAA
jgi:hypothetical protein